MGVRVWGNTGQMPCSFFFQQYRTWSSSSAFFSFPAESQWREVSAPLNLIVRDWQRNPARIRNQRKRWQIRVFDYLPQPRIRKPSSSDADELANYEHKPMPISSRPLKPPPRKWLKPIPHRNKEKCARFVLREIKNAIWRWWSQDTVQNLFFSCWTATTLFSSTLLVKRFVPLALVKPNETPATYYKRKLQQTVLAN